MLPQKNLVTIVGPVVSTLVMDDPTRKESKILVPGGLQDRPSSHILMTSFLYRLPVSLVKSRCVRLSKFRLLTFGVSNCLLKMHRDGQPVDGSVQLTGLIYLSDAVR